MWRAILDQSSDLEVERASPEELALRARFRSLEGEDPLKSEEVTDDQLSVLSALVKAGVAPYADFGVWRPFGQRTAKNLKFVSHFLDNSGRGDAKKFQDLIHSALGSLVGVCFERQRSCATLLPLRSSTDTLLVSANVLTGTPMRGICVCWLIHDVGQNFGKRNIGVKHNSTIQIRISLRMFQHVRGTVSSARQQMIGICGKKSWKTKFQISVKYGDLWTHHQQGKVDGTGRGQQDAKVQVRGKKGDVRVEATLKDPRMDAIERQPRARKFVLHTTTRRMVAKPSVRRGALMSVNFAWSRTGQSSAHNTQGGGHPRKVQKVPRSDHWIQVTNQ